jgi:RNA polymerase sigma-70 factor (ECF subfamily)
MTSADDPRELDGLRALDPQVVGAVYDRYQPVVYRYVAYRVGDPIQAEDIASDVFTRLLEAVSADRAPGTNLRAWLLSTAAHVVNDHFRKTYRQPTAELHDSLADPGIDPQVDVEHRERQRKLRVALADLTPEQQHVLALRFGEGFSLQETASVMKKNVNAIKQLQLRALAALNRKIGESQ